jgi:hypothetical protein
MAMRVQTGWKRMGRAGLAALGLTATLVGCDATQSGARRPHIRLTRGEVGTPSPASGSTYDLDAIRDGVKLELPDDNPSSVFTKGGKTGAWSSEARDIEKSLGVGP